MNGVPFQLLDWKVHYHTMETDDKENIDRHDNNSRVTPTMENSVKTDVPESDSVDMHMMMMLSDCPEAETKTNVAVDKREMRWVKDTLVYHGDSDDGSEVFFGDVTNVEIKTMLNKRKTAVSVPVFRIDRHLMHYTSCSPSLDQLDMTKNLVRNDFIMSNTTEKKVPAITKKQYGCECSSMEENLENKKNGPQKSKESVKTLVDELTDIDYELSGVKTKLEKRTSDMDPTLVLSELSKGSDKRTWTATKGETHNGQLSGIVCRDVGCMKMRTVETVADYDNLIAKVLKESLQEDDCTTLDCSLLLEGVIGKPGPQQSYFVPSEDNSSEDSGEEGSVNREIVNNMLQALDRRTAILSALAKMRQHPENNPNTRGKPESFEQMLKASEEKHGQLVARNSVLADESMEMKPISLHHNIKYPSKNCSEGLHGKFQRLQIQLEKVSENGFLSKCLDDSANDNHHVLELHPNATSSNQSCLEKECANSLSLQETMDDEKCAVNHTATAKENTQCLISLGHALKGDCGRKRLDGMSLCPRMLSNRRTESDSDRTLDPVPENFNRLSFSALPEPVCNIGAYPGHKDLVMTTIITHVADTENLEAILPELNVDDVIDLLKEGSGDDWFTLQKDAVPQRDTGSTGIMADGNLMHRRLVGDNTVVVASNNCLRSPYRATINHNLPDFPTRIGTTHTVTSVLRPISSPGALRCHSIYATIPSNSIEVKSQVNCRHSPATDLQTSFGGLKLVEPAVSNCSPTKSRMATAHMMTPSSTSSIQQHGNTLNTCLCSSKLQAHQFQSKQSLPIENVSSAMSNHQCLAEPRTKLLGASTVKPIQSCPKVHDFSPGVVFTETNFSPILKFHFPDSPRIQVPTGLKCAVHSASPPKSTRMNPSHFVTCGKKKQSHRNHRSATMVELSLNCQKGLTKVKTSSTKGRSPPKKVIGSPTIHRFHAAFGKNPASRSLSHQFGINVRAGPISKLGSRLNMPSASSQEAIVCAKSPAVNRTHSHKVDLRTNTSGTHKKKHSNGLKVKATSSAKVQSNTCVGGEPSKTQNSLLSCRTTASKSRKVLSNPKLVSSPAKNSTVCTTAASCDTEIPLSLWPSPSRQFPVRPGTPVLHAKDWSFCRSTLSSRPCCTTPQIVNGDTMQMFSRGCETLMTRQQNPAVSRPAPSVVLPADEEDLMDNLGISPLPLDRDASCGPQGSPRLSMTEVLERKRQQMITLRAEKRKISDIKTRQGYITAKALRANNCVPHDSLPKQRLANTQTLSLSDKELEAVTQVHTLCNSQRTVKVIHKGRAILIRQVPQIPHLPRRVLWNANLHVEISEVGAQTTTASPERAVSRSILTRKGARFVYPFDNESPPPVVVFRSRNGDLRRSARSPRID